MGVGRASLMIPTANRRLGGALQVGEVCFFGWPICAGPVCHAVGTGSRPYDVIYIYIYIFFSYMYIYIHMHGSWAGMHAASAGCTQPRPDHPGHSQQSCRAGTQALGEKVAPWAGPDAAESIRLTPNQIQCIQAAPNELDTHAVYLNRN